MISFNFLICRGVTFSHLLSVKKQRLWSGFSSLSLSLSRLKLQVRTNMVVYLTSLNLLLVPRYYKSRLISALPCPKFIPIHLICSRVDRPFTGTRYKKLVWSIRSASDDNRSANESGGGTRLIRTIRAVQFKLTARLKELTKDLPIKVFSFLVGFYCATAFATVIGQTGDWDVLSAALTVAVVEGIGALMYKASLPLIDNVKNIIIISNFWKAGLSLGLFLDSFKY